MGDLLSGIFQAIPTVVQVGTGIKYHGQKGKAWRFDCISALFGVCLSYSIHLYSSKNYQWSAVTTLTAGVIDILDNHSSKSKEAIHLGVGADSSSLSLLQRYHLKPALKMLCLTSAYLTARASPTWPFALACTVPLMPLTISLFSFWSANGRKFV